MKLRFAPTYSSWLNEVENWFSKRQRDVIDRGIFTSVADLRRNILRYARLYQKAAKRFQWNIPTSASASLCGSDGSGTRH